MRKGSKMSKEAREKISLAHLGKPTWNKGKKFSIEYREKLSKAHKGQKAWNKGKHPKYMQGSNNPAWKGGITKSRGYVFIRNTKHPFNHNGYVKRARIIMEKYIRHYLKPEEIVHHINGIKDDDRIKNLKLLANKFEHRKFHNPRLSPPH